MLGRRSFRAADSLGHEKRPKSFAKTAGPTKSSVAHGIRRHRAGDLATVQQDFEDDGGVGDRGAHLNFAEGVS